MTWKAAAQVEPLNMPSGLKFVLVKYANHADNDGYDAWPSYQRVAHFTGQAFKTVQRAVERMRDEGILIAQGDPYGGRGKRGRGIAYRIDFERAREVYGYWIERRTNTGFAFELVPPVVGVDGAAETVDTESTVSKPETVDSDAETVDIDGVNCGHESPATPQKTAIPSDESSKNPPEKRRARATGPADGPDAPALEGPPPACAVWRDHQAALEALGVWPLLRRAIPDADDGEVLTLAVEAPAVGFAILAWAAREVEAALGRRLACRVHKWVQPALIQRGIQTAGAPDTSAHRRDGETVTLQDPAWRLWSAKAAQLDAAEIQAITALCLPDDLDQTGLVLMVGSAAIAGMLRDEGGQQVAQVLGVPIRTRFLWCMDIVLDARAAADRGERGLQGREAI